MRGLKHPIIFRVGTVKLCRIFYRCVDWNLCVLFGRTTWIVASFTDAWIETFWAAIARFWRLVASFTDAWIETYVQRYKTVWTGSHLLQMRGLKPSLSAMFERGQIRSHLLQMRGLKLVMLIHLLISVLVASFTDAWIETLKYSRDFIQLRRIFYRCVDWNLIRFAISRAICRRIFYRCVDWNSYKEIIEGRFDGRIFYRCVDWNMKLQMLP